MTNRHALPFDVTGFAEGEWIPFPATLFFFSGLEDQTVCHGKHSGGTPVGTPLGHPLMAVGQKAERTDGLIHRKYRVRPLDLTFSRPLGHGDGIQQPQMLRIRACVKQYFFRVYDAASVVA